MSETKAYILKKLEHLKREIEELEDLIESDEELIFKEMSEDEARKLVLDYIEKHPGCLTSEIIENLGLDPLLVGKILKQLEEEGEVEGRSI
jgi:DNA-binding MarR family transcriptional regulator